MSDGWVTCPDEECVNGMIYNGNDGLHDKYVEHPDCVDGQTPGPELVAKVDRFSDAYRRGYEAGVRGSLPRRGNTR